MEASFATKNGLFDFQRTVLAMTALERHNLVLYGFTRSELNATLSWFKRIPVTTLRTAIGVSTSTGRSSHHRRLSPTQSAALLALVEITSDAESALGTKEQVEDWLTMPAYALDGFKPLDLLTTHPGQTALRTLVGRLEYSISA